MAERKCCTQCGYVSGDKDSVCPICGGRMVSQRVADACDTEYEEEWNAGAHDDFREGRKTGDYCDREMEENLNGGQHFHGDEHQTFTSKTKNEDEEKAVEKATLIFQAVMTLFPFLGYVSAYQYCAKDKNATPEFKRKIILVTIGTAVLKYIIIFFWSFISEI